MEGFDLLLKHIIVRESWASFAFTSKFIACESYCTIWLQLARSRPHWFSDAAWENQWGLLLATGLDARERILTIMTKKWEGWGGGDEDNEVDVKERIKGLAKLTKGYGGADLRVQFRVLLSFFVLFWFWWFSLLHKKALCTEAALNAIQRRYPQVYKTDDRLLLKPETIGVGLRDFMISIKSKRSLFDI